MNGNNSTSSTKRDTVCTQISNSVAKFRSSTNAMFRSKQNIRGSGRSFSVECERRNLNVAFLPGTVFCKSRRSHISCSLHSMNCSNWHCLSRVWQTGHGSSFTTFQPFKHFCTHSLPLWSEHSFCIIGTLLWLS